MDTTRGRFQMHVKIYLELKFTVEKVKESINSQIKVVNACTNMRIRISPFLRTKKQSGLRLVNVSPDLKMPTILQMCIKNRVCALQVCNDKV